MFGDPEGNKIAEPEDEMLHKACAIARYTNNDLAYLKKRFTKYDKDGSGSLDMDEFYSLFGSKRSPFGDGIFNLVNLDGDGDFLSFSEFVTVVTTYCLFGPNEIIRFAFNVVDEDKSGFASFEELDNLATWLHKDGPANLNTAIEKIKTTYDQGDQNVSFESFKKVQKEYPFLFFPAFKLQEDMMVRVFGKRWWQKKQRELGMVKDGDEKGKKGDADSRSLLSRMFPSLFPHKDKGDGNDDAQHKGQIGPKLPPPGPETLAYQDFLVEVSKVSEHIELERKDRVKKAKDNKKKAAAKELALKQARIQRRRERMLSKDMMDPNGPPLLLTHQPRSVVSIYNKNE